MKKIIIAAIVCGLTIGFMLIGFNLYQQKQEEIRQEELRLEEEARQEELAQQQKTAEMTWKANYVVLCEDISKHVLLAANTATEAAGEFMSQGQQSTDSQTMKTLIDGNNTITNNVKTLKAFCKTMELEMDTMRNYPSDCFSAYSALFSTWNWCELIINDVTSTNFLYATEVARWQANVDLLQNKIESCSDAASSAAVWEAKYRDECDAWQAKQ